MKFFSQNMPLRIQKYLHRPKKQKSSCSSKQPVETNITITKRNLFFGEKQNGKHVDETLREYFPDYHYKGIFFDVGAFEPITISNSHHFYLHGWDVYCFEANPHKIPLLQKHRQHVFNYAITDTDTDEPMPFENVNRNGWTASFSSIKVSDKYKEIFNWNDKVQTIDVFHVQQKTLNTIIQNEIPTLSHIDIMSVDVEGFELQVLHGLDLDKYPPKVIVLENVDHNKQITNYLELFGYTLDKQISYNEYYLKK